MIRYSPASQLRFDNFSVPSLQKLNPSNRWVVMAELMPWDELAMVFVASPAAPKLHGLGRPTLDLRLVMGALLVQQIEGLSDERTLELINENVYVQFFCGLPGFQVTPLFDSSSMTHWRSWLGDSGAAALSETLADIFEQRRKEDLKSSNKNVEDDNDLNGPNKLRQDASIEPAQINEAGHEKLKPNQGTLLLDATCAPTNVSYPTDTGLLNHARYSLESILDKLWSQCLITECAPATKPRTYRLSVRKSFASFSRKRRPSKKAIRKQRRKQLQWVERNLKHIDSLFDLLVVTDAHVGVLTSAEYKRLRVCHELCRQQRQMHDTKTSRCDNRIVSLDQPHIRPIVRGKAGARVEFLAEARCKPKQWHCTS